MDDNDNFTTAAESADAPAWERADGQPSGCEGDAGAVGSGMKDAKAWLQDELIASKQKGAGV